MHWTHCHKYAFVVQRSIAKEEELVSNSKEFNFKSLEGMDPILRGIIKSMNTAGLIGIWEVFPAYEYLQTWAQDNWYVYCSSPFKFLLRLNSHW